MIIPENVAIIMDGNGRWALKRGFIRSAGHARGVDALRKVLHECYDIGVKTLTVYAFSTENWQRPQEEVDALMSLLLKYLKNYVEELGGRDIRLVAMGDKSAFSDELQKELNFVEAQTKENKIFTFNICLNYGGRAEIAHAANSIIKSGLPEVSEEIFADFLYGIGNRDIDLVIRTSGELRLSNFLLWQSAYAEFYFTKKLFPAFTPKDLHKAIKAYNKRDRRKGKVSS